MNQTHKCRLMFGAFAALMLLLSLNACEVPPTSTKLDIDPTAKPAADETLVIEQPTADTPVGALIHRIDLPLAVSLEPCWTTVNESSVPMLKRGMWQINGLRIGVLHADNAPAFAQSLPDIHGESRAKLIGSPHPSPVRSTPRLIQPVMVDLTDPPKSPQVIKLRGGKLQLLAKISRDESGQAYLELTPHHYKPKAELIPRSPLEKQLDGRVFDTLTARLALTADTAIVVGLYRPWLKPVDLRIPLDQTETQAAQEPTKTTEDAGDASEVLDEIDPEQVSSEASENTEPQQPEIPNHLGKALMAGRRAGHDTQVIMVISLLDDLE